MIFEHLEHNTEEPLLCESLFFEYLNIREMSVM